MPDRFEGPDDTQYLALVRPYVRRLGSDVSWAGGGVGSSAGPQHSGGGEGVFWADFQTVSGYPETAGGLTAATPFGYAGGYTDPTGLIYLLNRYYDPQAGQFISVDPALTQTLQPYEYAGDNPVTNTDPNGECWWGWKCWHQRLVDWAVTSAFWAISAAVAIACLDATAGVCGMFWSFIFDITLGAAQNVLQCWWDGSCQDAGDYAWAAFTGIWYGGLAWVLGWLFIPRADIVWLKYRLWDLTYRAVYWSLWALQGGF